MDAIISTKTQTAEVLPKQQMPLMEVNVGNSSLKPEKEIISDDQMIGVYNEILGMIREDRAEVSDQIVNFVDMVTNGGDASSSSKEALVNLLKIKTDLSNNMTRMFDLLARIKMRDKSLPDVVAKQVNKFNIGGGQSKRKIFDAIAKESAAKKKE